MSPAERALQFLQVASQFKLGHLVTESFHEKTSSLSSVVQKNVSEALTLLSSVDREALSLLYKKEEELWKLQQDIQKTLKAGRKVFMCGCGATGRLSLVLETLFRHEYGQTNQVLSFMAGGDFALVKSVESFEDRTDYGERQLLELGFGPGDLLLASTEGGETPFVIGATEKAAQISNQSPYFLYCNPDELLSPIERSRKVIENPNIKKINLTVGPMAISGSTRMQASTVLMLAVGVGLLYKHKNRSDFGDFYRSLLNALESVDYSPLAPLTLLEAKLYESKKYCNYLSDSYLGISILTDTTERSPTFSLKGFENRLDHQSDHALAYLFLSKGESSGHAWSELLGRPPRPLEWPELNGRINLERLLGFDISEQGRQNRSQVVPTVDFSIFQKNGEVEFSCAETKAVFSVGNDRLLTHLTVKMLLNAHSTLIMGLLGRYEGNVMTWVRPSNNKLIDRAARYCLQLLKQRGEFVSYDDVVLKIYEEMATASENEPVVLKVLNRY